MNLECNIKCQILKLSNVQVLSQRGELVLGLVP